MRQQRLNNLVLHSRSHGELRNISEHMTLKPESMCSPESIPSTHMTNCSVENDAERNAQMSRRFNKEKSRAKPNAECTKEDESTRIILSNDMDKKESPAEFPYHPVPSFLWKRYKANAKKGGRQSSCDASSRTSKASSHLFGTGPRAPYSYGGREIVPAHP